MHLRFCLVASALLLSACAHAPKAAPGAVSTPAEAPRPEVVHAPRDVRVTHGLLPAMPEAVTSFGATSADGYLYVLGGYNGEPHNYSQAGQRKGLWRLALDGQSDWQQLSQLEHGLQGLSLVHHRGKLCRVGGTQARNTADQSADLHSSADASCFDLNSKVWTALPALPAGRSSHEAAVIGDTLYVAGGWTLSGEPGKGAWQEALAAIDLNAPQAGWRSIAAPFKRRALGVAEAAGKLVMVGGITAEGEPSQQVDLYDPATNTFSRGPDYPDNAFGIAVEGMGDTVFASARSGVVYRWRVGDAQWQAVARLSFKRFFHQLAATSDGQLIAVGGISGMHNQGRTVHVERVELTSQAARVVAWSMAYPGQAKNRQGVLVHGDYVYLFGGNNSLEQHDFEPQNFVDQTLRVHIPSLQVAEIQPYPARRQTMQTVSGEERGLALGGFGHDGQKAVSSAEGYSFEFESEQWGKSVSLPESRTQFGLAQYENELWAFGGLNYDPARKGEDAFKHVLSVLHGKAEAGTTLQLADVVLPAPRRAFAGAVLGDSYYLLGGMRSDFELVEDCARYDFKQHTFAPLACPAQVARLSGSLIALGGKLYLAGGSVRGDGGLVSAQDLVELDPKSGTVRTVIAQLPFDTRHMHAVAFQEQILLISTHNADGRVYFALVNPQPYPASAP